MTDDLGRLIEEVGAVLAAGPALKLAILFGSGARGRLRPDSDLDIAILPKDASLALRVELDLQVALERATRRTVDIVRLDHAPTLLRWEIARHGRVLVADPAAERVRFLAQAAAEHADFAPDLQQAATLFRRHLAGRSAPAAKPAR